MPELTSQHPFAKGTSPAERRQARQFLTGYAAALDGSRAGLQSPRAPEDGKRLLDGYLRDVRTVVGELRTASEAPPREVEGEANPAFALFARASRQTAAYGFPSGVCGSGEAG